VGKTDEEIRAGLEAGVLMFNVESEAELDAIARVAQAEGKTAPIALRVNPDVDPKTHRYISTGKKESKFGMDVARSLALAAVVARTPGVTMIGMHMHIGSQITTAEPYAGAVAKGVEIVAELRRMGHPIAWYNMGGGFGINYRGTEARPIAEFARAIVPGVASTGCRLAMEPGRVIAGNAGILVSRVLYTKQSGEKRFLIQDAAMNDLIRPALYESFHRIWPVAVPAGCPPPPTTSRPRSPGPSRGTWSARSARAATSWPRTAPCRRSAATPCSPPSRRAPTAWSWPRTTTRAPAPPRSSSTGPPPAWSAAASRTRTWSCTSWTRSRPSPDDREGGASGAPIRFLRVKMPLRE
jgi:hypothetical protein